MAEAAAASPACGVPHLPQNRAPGFKIAPQLAHTSGSGCAGGIGVTGAGTGVETLAAANGTFAPQAAQKCAPATSSAPHMAQVVGAGGGGGSVLAPQAGQKWAPGFSAAPQDAHGSPGSWCVPHSGQNAAPSGTFAPHAVQGIAVPGISLSPGWSSRGVRGVELTMPPYGSGGDGRMAPFPPPSGACSPLGQTSRHPARAEDPSPPGYGLLRMPRDRPARQGSCFAAE